MREVFDGTNHLAGVAVFVVVPGNNLNLAVAVFHVDDHGLGCVEDRTESGTYDIGRNDFVGVISEGFGSGCLHSFVDLFFGNVTLNYCYENSGRTGRSGYALSGTDELACEFGDNETDSLSCAGGVRNDIDCGCSGSAEVALSLRSVERHLVAGVSVYGGHDTCLDGSEFVKSLSHRSEAVGGTGRCGDDVIFFGERGVVYVVDDGGKVVSCGSGDYDFLSACVDMSLSFCLGGVETGTFEDYVYVESFPGKFLCFCLSVDDDFLSVDYDISVFFNGSVFVKYGFSVSNGMVVGIVALGAVILQKVSEHFGAGKVVDCYDFKTFRSEHLSESKTADSSETVNRNSNIFGHKNISS